MKKKYHIIKIFNEIDQCVGVLYKDKIQWNYDYQYSLIFKGALEIVQKYIKNKDFELCKKSSKYLLERNVIPILYCKRTLNDGEEKLFAENSFTSMSFAIPPENKKENKKPKILLQDILSYLKWI